MTTYSAEFHLVSPEDTALLARCLGALLRAGDCVLLSGGIGAGKSHFARALILSRLPEPEDVPSPTFTLVQTYDLDEGDLWHADLYRLGDVDHIVELGLVDAMQSAITLIEWPDRLADLVPENALHIDISDPNKDDTRKIRVHATNPRWANVIEALQT